MLTKDAQPSHQNNKHMPKIHIDKRKGAVKTMCNIPPPFQGEGNISIADCIFLSSLLKTI